MRDSKEVEVVMSGFLAGYVGDIVFEDGRLPSILVKGMWASCGNKRSNADVDAFDDFWRECIEVREKRIRAGEKTVGAWVSHELP